MDADTDLAARTALARLLGTAAAAGATLVPLAGGINRRSFRVAAAGKQLVLQLPIAGATGLLDVTAEAAIMRAAAVAGIAPIVVAVDGARGVLLTEFRARSHSWTATDARDPRNIVRAGALLRRLHAIAANAPVYVAERFARDYLAALAAGVAAGRARFDERARNWADELLERARRYDVSHVPTALCHNDLVAANVLDDGDLALVDFEYAVRSAPVLDLAGLAGLNDYGERECRDLLDAYHGDGPAQVSLAELEEIMRMVRLVAYFWARLGELRVADSAACSELAAELELRLN